MKIIATIDGKQREIPFDQCAVKLDDTEVWGCVVAGGDANSNHRADVSVHGSMRIPFIGPVRWPITGLKTVDLPIREAIELATSIAPTLATSAGLPPIARSLAGGLGKVVPLVRAIFSLP